MRAFSWSLDQLQAFAATVQYGSISAAARYLNKAQSRVSVAISNLEIDLGFALFDRTGRYPTLTAQGESLYPEAIALLQQCQLLDGKMATIAIGEEVELTLALDEAFPEQAIEQVLTEFSQEYPQFKLTMINGNQDDIVNYVTQKQAHLGLVVHANQLHFDLEHLMLGHLDFAVVVGIDHPLTALKQVTVQDLKRYRQYVNCNKKGEPYLPPISSNCWLFDSYYYALSLVIQGLGWAILPKHIAQHSHYKTLLVNLEVNDLTLFQDASISVIRRRDSANGPVMQWLIRRLNLHM